MFRLMLAGSKDEHSDEILFERELISIMSLARSSYHRKGLSLASISTLAPLYARLQRSFTARLLVKWRGDPRLRAMRRR